MLGVLFGLASALVWGGGDFTGGLAARRNHPLQVLVVASLSGMLLLALFALVSRERLPSPRDTGWAATAGLSGAVGIAALYRSLATENAARVAPVAAVVSAAIPVAVGSVIQGWPSPAQIVGIGAAFLGVCFVSFSQVASDGDPSKGFGLAWVAGVGFGGFLVLIAQVETGPVFAPLVVARTVSLCAGLVLVLALGLGKLTPHRPAVACLAGCLDAGGNVLYLLATRYARLDVAAVLSSMYPAATVALACWLLSQRVSRTQWFGVSLCLLAVALMAA